jgi:hypothetical protein
MAELVNEDDAEEDRRPGNGILNANADAARSRDKRQNQQQQ